LGSDQIRIGNGKGLSIKHIGTTRLSTPISHFDLLDILHVPHITKNFTSVQKFTKDTNTFFEFHPSHFFLKDRRTGKLLLHGPNKHGLYQFFPSTNKHPVMPWWVNVFLLFNGTHGWAIPPWRLSVVCFPIFSFQLHLQQTPLFALPALVQKASNFPFLQLPDLPIVLLT
jgi:hypothetical protein